MSRLARARALLRQSLGRSRPAGKAGAREPSCDAMRRLISPYLDGELVGEDRADFEAHVRGCDACRALARAGALGGAGRAGVAAALRGARPRCASAWAARAPRRPCRRRVRVAAGRGARSAAARRRGVARRRSRSPPPRCCARRVAPAPRAGRGFASLAVDTHLRYARGQLPLEVRSERARPRSRASSTVACRSTSRCPTTRWSRASRSPIGCEGGRLVAFEGDYAAYVAYRMDERPISLLVDVGRAVTPGGRRGGDVGRPDVPHRVGRRAQGHHLERQGADVRAGLGPRGRPAAVRAWSATARPRSGARSRGSEPEPFEEAHHEACSFSHCCWPAASCPPRWILR